MDGIPQRIRIIMAELGLDDEGLAGSIGLTRPAISYWLSGKTRPSWNNAQKIENTHDYSVSWIMTGLGNKRAGKRDRGAVGKAGMSSHPPPDFQGGRRRSDRRISSKTSPLKRA